MQYIDDYFCLNVKMDVKVIGPIKEYLKTFNGPDDFNIWYAKNKDEVDKLTTHKLNKMYHIDGFRITKIKGVLCLKKDIKKQSETNDTLNANESEIHHESLADIIDYQEIFSTEIEQIKKDIISIKLAINEIVKSLNGS